MPGNSRTIFFSISIKPYRMTHQNSVVFKDWYKSNRQFVKKKRKKKHPARMLKVYVLLSLIAGAHLVVLPFSLRTTTEAGIDGEKPVRPNFGNNFAGLFGGALGGLRGGIRGDAGFGGQINVAENAIKNADAEPVSDAHSEYGVPEEEPHSEYGVPKALPAIEATTAQ